ncbi:hypothetical protein EDB89DRAFT_382888 [Lactarius sanguifluus]|nr:hypothetical protein EDB89DRAFT_871989 [Lactarius sanguifluus]KAH9164924.1 hypothetical protein EDB89DRAFT_382888 [Lactarius sanguifluus]
MPHGSRFHKAEAKFNVTTEFPHLGLHSAAVTGNIGLAKYALSHGQPINSVIDGVLPLHAACSGGNDMVVRLLIDNGADVNAPRLSRRYSDKTRSPSAPIIGTTGSTPLHFASANGHTQVVLTLLRHGARPDRADKRGVTPELLARQNGWLACADAIRDWVANKDRDLVERETLLGGIPPDDPEPISHCRERHGSLCACEGPECMTTHVMRRLGVKRSIENAMLLFCPGTSLQDGAIALPDSTWPPPETLDLPPSPSRRPSLQPTDEHPPQRRSHRRSRRPSSAGNGAERNHHSHSRRLGSKYSLLHIFRKSSTEVLSSHSTPGGATPDISTGTATSNTTSSPTSPLSSSPSALALGLSGLGLEGSPSVRPGIIRSNGGSFGSSTSTGGSVPPVSISVSRPPQPPQPSRSLHSRSSEPNVASGSRGKSPGRAPFGTSPGHDGRLSEESEDEDEDEEYGVDAVRSRMIAGDSSTQDMDFPFSLDVPVDEVPELGDVRGRGDSLSTTLSATTVSTASLRTPAPLSAVLPPGIEDAKSHVYTHRPPPLTGLDTSSVSSYAQAEALVALARGQVLTAREGDDIPLSARLAALGESLRLERRFKEAEELGGMGVHSANAVLRIERHVSENTALDSTDADPWEHRRLLGGKMRSASASAAGRTSFDLPPSRRSTSGVGSTGTDRNFSADYKVGLSWRGRVRHPHTSEILLRSGDGLLVPPSDQGVHEDRHRSRSAAPTWSESEGPRKSTETRSVRTPIQSPRLIRAPSLENLSDDASPPVPLATTLKSAPVVTASPPPPFRSRTPDPDYARGAPLSRVVTEPMRDSTLFNYVAPSPVDVVARRGNERAQAVSRANKLAKMGFTPESKVLSTGTSTPPSHGHGHGHGHGHKFGIRSLVQSLKGKS